jgi:hypothetical protein
VEVLEFPGYSASKFNREGFYSGSTSHVL